MGYSSRSRNGLPLLSTWVHPRLLVEFVLLIILISVLCFCLCLFSSCVLCPQCCQFLWIVHYWLPLRFSPTFIAFMVFGLMYAVVNFVLYCINFMQNYKLNTDYCYLHSSNYYPTSHKTAICFPLTNIYNYTSCKFL